MWKGGFMWWIKWKKEWKYEKIKKILEVTFQTLTNKKVKEADWRIEPMY